MTEATSESRLRAIEERLQALEDDREIRELLAVYGFHADSMHDEEYLDLWTDDGALDLVGSIDAHKGDDALISRRWEGKESLREFITDPTSHHKPGFYGKSLHVQGNNLFVRVIGDAALALSYSIVLQSIEGKTTMVTAGFNRWRLRREAQGWRIEERVRREVGEEDIPAIVKSALSFEA